MSENIREIVESPLPQGKDEKIAYRLTTTPWGGTPSGGEDLRRGRHGLFQHPAFRHAVGERGHRDNAICAASHAGEALPAGNPIHQRRQYLRAVYVPEG